MIIFFVYLILFALLLRGFYTLHRILNKGYYSFYELITGLPSELTISQLFFVRFLPPIITGFVAFKLIEMLQNMSIYWFSLIGLIAALINIVPAIINILKYNGSDHMIIRLKRNFSSLIVIYLMYVLSFTFLTALGAHLASSSPIFKIEQILPSKQGIVDALWGVIIVWLLAKTNKQI